MRLWAGLDKTGPALLDDKQFVDYTSEHPGNPFQGGYMAQPTILVVEDENDIRELVEYNLKQAGYKVLCAKDGLEATEILRGQRPDLVVLDIMLPHIDGREVCRRIRQDRQTRNTPVLILSALSEETDRIVGFEIGADDYLTKPFSTRELVLRVGAILRRAQGDEPEAELLSWPGLVIDPEAHRVEVNGQAVELTATEFRLLYQLAGSAGRVQTRRVLLEQVWGYTFDGYARTVDTHIRRLRQKLGDMGRRIETVRGLGYRFSDEP
jgi:two-component system phosphate regulon response regulator PhoB